MGKEKYNKEELIRLLIHKENLIKKLQLCGVMEALEKLYVKQQIDTG